MLNDSPIAIVGLAYRAPGVGGKGLWEFLDGAKSAWSRVPTDRFDQDAFYHPDSEKAGCFSSRGAHFLPDDIYSFDAPFFNLRANEACAVDPQHRILLECALEAADSAGLSLDDMAGANIGVFTAIGSPDCAQQAAEDLPSTTSWTAAGISYCMFANRLSYFFDLAGPSVSLDAACASSSYAVHLACQSLRFGDCDAAFVGAATLLVTPNYWTMLDKMGALSPEGKCFSYDARASGFGRGEGAACLVVKRLADAIESRDPIHAVIRNTACSHSGRSEGITMPRRTAQEKLLLRVHQEIGLNPSETAVVEGHGTGTKVGDPIEAGAFITVLASERSPSDPLYIGSLKSNFGHLESASGVLAMVKAILMIQRGCVLPNAGFEEFNEKIERIDKLKVAIKTMPWPPKAPKRVCVTNYGFGGSNAAAILEEAPTVFRQSDRGANPKANSLATHHVSRDPVQRLFVFSAKSETSLTSYLSSFIEYLDTVSESSNFAKDLSYTLVQRRTHYPYRVAVTADFLSSLKAQLLAVNASKIKDWAIAYVFTGQGAQHAQMAGGLRRYKAFADAIDRAEAYLSAMGSSWSLTAELDKPESESRIHDAEIGQPACTAVQLALVMLLKSWGVTPTKVTGHSSGEISAAFTAGLISFRAAIAIAYFRGQAAAQVTQKGAMLAVGTTLEEASTLVESVSGYATIAAVNSPNSVTVSGDQSAVDTIQHIANEQGLFARRLKVQVAYHSRHMDQVAATYLASIEPFCTPVPSLNGDMSHPVFISSVTGRIVGPEKLDASYWHQNLLEPVRFADAIETLFSTNRDQCSAGQRRVKLQVVVEIGPHPALENPVTQTVQCLQRVDNRQANFTYFSSLLRGTGGYEALLGLAGNLFSVGSSIQLATVTQTDYHDAHVLTTLPPYAWDKSKRYMPISRITQGKLHPGQPYHPLLGWKSWNSEGDEHIFRQVFTLDEMPWLRDHKLDGHVVFPLAGFLSMAIAAGRRVSRSVSCILVQEFHAKRSLRIEEEERIDITTKLRPAVTGTETFSSTAWMFEVMSWSEADGWVIHCHGRVEAEASELTMESPTFKASKPLINSDELQERNAELEYATQRRNGVIFGPAFQPLVRLWKGPGWTVTESKLHGPVLPCPHDQGSPVSVDPPTLDGFLHGVGPLQEILQGATRKRLVQMPNYVSRLRISNKIPADNKQRFTAITRLLDRDAKAGSMRISVAVFAQCPGSLLPIAEWESVGFRSIGSPDSGESSLDLPASYYWDLIPSLDFADHDLAKMIEVDPYGEDELLSRRQLMRIAVYYLDLAVKEMAGDDISQLAPYHSDFLNWARRTVAQEKQLPLDSELPWLLAVISSSDALGKLLCAVGEQLVPILRGHVQPLEIMLKDNLLARHYEEDKAVARCSRMLARCVSRLADVKPELRILEVGAGTGGTTLPVLEELSRGADGSPTFSSYTFTDISPGFFENARVKLAKWSQTIIYKKLDISQDPLQQSFAAEDYDLVIASNVLHATPDIAVTLDHVRSLLKPNGKLLLLEIIIHAPQTMIAAVLPGWWLADDEYRSGKEGPLLSQDMWHRVLSARGFSGVDCAIADYPDAPEHCISVMCSTRLGIQQDSRDTRPITICGPLKDKEEMEFARSVSDHVTLRLSCPSLIKPISDMGAADNPFCIFIDSPRHSVLTNMASHSFEALKNILLHMTVLWVVPENHGPDAEIMKGVLFKLRQETESKNLLWLENTPCTSQGASEIAKIAQRLGDPALLAGSVDHDFVWQNGMMQVPRLRPLPASDEALAILAGVPVRRMQNIWQGNDALEMTVDAAGSPDSIYFHRTNVPTQHLGDGEVLIRVEASGINFRDLLVVLGSIPWTRLGNEGAGVIVRLGPHVVDLQPGDRVFYWAPRGGSFATYMRIPSWLCYKVPADMSSIDAASIPVAYSTAVMALMHIARLKKGESVLIHAATGAVGQACIVLAQYLGARVFATAGSPTKREFLHTTFAIPKARIFSSRTSDFRDGILCASDGKGVDVIVNSLSGNLLQETWALIADFGRFVEIGKRDLLQNSHLAMRPFNRNVTFSGVDLGAFYDKRPEELRECLLEVVDLLQRNIVTPIRPVMTLPISEMVTALRKLQSGTNVGKIVVTMGADESVLAECTELLDGPSSRLLRADVTYLITGGTGGIGLSLTPWMIDNGASNVVLLGRSGSSRPEVRKLLERYEGTNVHVRAIACDVGSREDLIQALQSIQNLPPVRGVVHGAMFLRDSLLANASYDDWQDITRPRIQGAWNLHELLPELDVFVILSSFVGTPNVLGQTIYSGTATFFDAFTTYRNARGLTAVAISLPVILEVGYVADRDLAESFTTRSGLMLTEAQLHAAVKGAIIGPSSGINYGGKVISLGFASETFRSSLPRQYLHLSDFTRCFNAEKRKPEVNDLSQREDIRSNGLRETYNADLLSGLLDALMSKVCSITVTDRDRVEPDTPLSTYGLDSLISVELRNWIHRETGVELSIPRISGAENLRALATQILSQKDQIAVLTAR